ncbi:MAG: hypothetical protein KME38_03620 [Spirirestis rafaelensis WJT71-NPBG6]|jgi:hypothetical protein|nr:hypothetical protein [Spirirestis rafaelensis WJT71-NPBG6]
MEIIDNNASQLLTITEQKPEKLKDKSSQKKMITTIGISLDAIKAVPRS